MQKRWIKYGSLLLLIFFAVNLYLPSAIGEVEAAQDEITEDAATEDGNEEGNTENGLIEDGIMSYSLSDDDTTEEVVPWYGEESGDQYTINITYDLNGGSSDTISNSKYMTSEEKFSITLAVAPTKDDAVFAGWLSSIDNKLYQPEEVISELSSSTYNGQEITFTAQWNMQGEDESTTITQGTTRELQAGTKYQLGEGSWQVSGDPSVYVGGNEFYVGTTGSYTFTK